jgi:hypothetical protein
MRCHELFLKGHIADSDSSQKLRVSPLERNSCKCSVNAADARLPPNCPADSLPKATRMAPMPKKKKLSRMLEEAWVTAARPASTCSFSLVDIGLIHLIHALRSKPQ